MRLRYIILLRPPMRSINPISPSLQQKPALVTTPTKTTHKPPPNNLHTSPQIKTSETTAAQLPLSNTTPDMCFILRSRPLPSHLRTHEPLNPTSQLKS